MKINIENERMKRKYFTHLKHGERLADSTINHIKNVIRLYEDFSKNEDFKKFSAEKAIAFKEWLSKREHQGKTISLPTFHCYLRSMSKFFVWLSDKPGYKSKIASDNIIYLRLNRKDEKAATQSMPRNFPPLEYVLRLADSIKIETEIDMRDRAMIAFALLSGGRDKAMTTLPLGCFDEEALIVYQNPRAGVETKFSKMILTVMPRYHEKLIGYVKEWVKHLKSKGFGSQDPLFPCSLTNKGENNLSFESAQKVTRTFWKTTGPIREIFQSRASEAGLPYFQPHTYRHTAFYLAKKACKNIEEFSAISQSFGHEYVAISLQSYANYDPMTLSEIIKKLDFNNRQDDC